MQLLKHGLSHTLHWSKTSEHSWVKVWKKRIFGTHPLLLCVFGGLKLHYSSCVCTALWGECLSLSMCETESVWCTFFTHSVCWWCVNARRRQTLRKQDLMPSDAFPALTFPVFCCLFFFLQHFCFPSRCCTRNPSLQHMSYQVPGSVVQPPPPVQLNYFSQRHASVYFLLLPSFLLPFCLCISHSLSFPSCILHPAKC